MAATVAPLYVDGIPLDPAQLIVHSPTLPREADRRFWATPVRSQGDTTRDILEVRHSGPRMSNYITVSIPRFPHTVSVEWYEPEAGVWLPVRDRNGFPITAQVTDSIPAEIVSMNTRPGQPHPQHAGPGHWMQISWRIRKTTAARWRFIFVRSNGIAPVDKMTGLAVDYSLGARNIDIGYRIYAKEDIPSGGIIRTESDSMASSTDYLGSRVEYALNTLPASDALDPTLKRPAWRSEPQPVNYAVVNFYSDVRDGDGDGQVIDRFYIDPLTVGAHCNLYFSDDEPNSAWFEADDDPLIYPLVQGHGISDSPDQDHLDLNGSGISVDVDNRAIQWKVGNAWWLALRGYMQFDIGDSSNDHPLIDLGGNVLRFFDGSLQFVAASGDVADLPMPSTPTNAPVSVILGATPDGSGNTLISLVVRVASQDPQVFSMLFRRPMTTDSRTIRIGGYTSGAVANSGVWLTALILKQGSLLDGDRDAFLADPDNAPIKPDADDQRPDQTHNALLRFHPSGLSHTYPTGLVGGPGSIYDNLVWTPVQRDFTLKRGYLEFPAVRAKFFKFEFTKLVAEHYEVFVPMQRKVKLFRYDTVLQFARTRGPWALSKAGPGWQTSQDVALSRMYADALGLLTGLLAQSGQSPTSVLIPNDPIRQDQLRDLGWVWNFDPWHLGAGAPRFVQTTKHYYETTTITHKTKIGYFAGIKFLQAFRVDYTADDDTPRYETTFLDLGVASTAHPLSIVESVNGLVFTGSSIRTAPGDSRSYAEAVSVNLLSRRRVRGVQFATVQTDPAQILDDDLLQHVLDTWTRYGDADIEQIDGGGALVRRNWTPRTYGDLEAMTYADIEALGTYGNVEGAVTTTGEAAGGFTSVRMVPSGAGRLYAAVRVSATDALNAPIVVQIIGADTGTVFAEKDQAVRQGETVNIIAAYTPGSALAPLTYADMEAFTYAQLESTTYGSHESVAINEDVQVRVFQRGKTSDVFTVRRASLFDDAISWEFSNNNGGDWFAAPDIRNDPNGALLFPLTSTPAPTAVAADVIVMQTGYDVLWKIAADGTVLYADPLDSSDANKQEITSASLLDGDWLTFGFSHDGASGTGPVVARRDPTTLAVTEWLPASGTAGEVNTDPILASGSAAFTEGRRLPDGRVVLFDGSVNVYAPGADHSVDGPIGNGAVVVLSADLSTIEGTYGPITPWYGDAALTAFGLDLAAEDQATASDATADNKVLVCVSGPGVDDSAHQFVPFNPDTGEWEAAVATEGVGTPPPAVYVAINPTFASNYQSVSDLAVDWVTGRFAVVRQWNNTFFGIDIHAPTGEVIDRLIPDDNGGGPGSGTGDCWVGYSLSIPAIAFDDDGLLYVAGPDFNQTTPHANTWKVNLDTGDGARVNPEPWVTGWDHDNTSPSSVSWAINWNEGIHDQQTRIAVARGAGATVAAATDGSLRWRMRAYRLGQEVTALAIRPWYAGGTADQPVQRGVSIGPNRNPVDQYSPIENDPMWKNRTSGVPSWWFNASQTVSAELNSLPYVMLPDGRRNYFANVAESAGAVDSVDSPKSTSSSSSDVTSISDGSTGIRTQPRTSSDGVAVTDIAVPSAG